MYGLCMPDSCFLTSKPFSASVRGLPVLFSSLFLRLETCLHVDKSHKKRRTCKYQVPHTCIQSMRSMRWQSFFRSHRRDPQSRVIRKLVSSEEKIQLPARDARYEPQRIDHIDRELPALKHSAEILGTRRKGERNKLCGLWQKRCQNV
jgi:hypothetical protein